ncbi:MAG: DUF1059 domain-containing protein [Acidimicrobiales bacterium]
MGYSFACGDVMPGCAATFEADTEDELMGQVVNHAQEGHGLAPSDLSPETVEKVKAAITTS